MTVSPRLVPDLQKRVRLLEADLRGQSDDPSNEWGAALRTEHARALSRGRTGLSWSEWRDGEVAQAAVAWVLACVFVRFCEDNGLIDGVWLAGPGERTARAVDAETAFYTEVPSRTATDWVRESFGVLAGLPAGRGLVDPAHSPVWSSAIGPDAARELVAFWRETGPDGELLRDFTDPELDTRFLGDLYQDLSEFAKKKYALLQTPVFVEEFILDRTLTPAVEEFGLEGLRLIDPTCGSGHFLLGAFGRLLEAWAVHAPGLTPEARVQKALDSVHGVDLNPFAVAIARFRLTVAALQASGISSLANAPAFAFSVAVGDSLLAGTAGRQGELFAPGDDENSVGTFHYPAEDISDYAWILDPGRYHVVVGNPPYVPTADPALRDAYRARYQHCSGRWVLTVPFMQRFFELGKRGDGARGAAYVGQITANSFMRRDFGKRLVEVLLAGADIACPVDLRLVVDTSGAFIPGHGTPTVILIGRTRFAGTDPVDVVFGIRGETTQPDDPASAPVWMEILEATARVPFEGEFVGSVSRSRESLRTHPWRLSGGVPAQLTDALIEGARTTLADYVTRVGLFGSSHQEDLFAGTKRSLLRMGAATQDVHRAIDGDLVRDYRYRCRETLLLGTGAVEHPDLGESTRRVMWPWRTTLWARATFGKGTYRAAGRDWLSWHQVSAKPGAQRRLISPLISTHNHFVETEDEAVEKPGVFRLELADEGQSTHLAAVLNTSVTCFWLKQVCHNKGSTVSVSGARTTLAPWEDFYEFSAGNLLTIPLPPRPLREEVVQRLRSVSESLLELEERLGTASAPSSQNAQAGASAALAQMTFLQEELDWDAYHAFGLVGPELLSQGGHLQSVDLGERAFEISLARRMAAGLGRSTWFERHGSTPTTALPNEWSDEYRQVVERRLALIDSDPFINLLERPEFKRRWASRSWEELEREALTEFVLDRLEDPGLWSMSASPGVVSVARLADRMRGDAQLVEALRLLTGQQDVDVTAELSRLVAGECVPFLAAYRYTESGLTKRAEWESVWALQRREDAGEKVDIPVPPKYTNKDFAKQSYWSARGKLDVPKERFVSFPGLERAGDVTLVLGWAGWDHLEQARALASAISQGAQEEGWGRDRLVPLLAGLAELEPWLHQWHDDPDPLFAGSPAVFMTAFLDGELDRLGLTRNDLATWRPAAASRGRGRKAAAVQEEIDS